MKLDLHIAAACRVAHCYACRVWVLVLACGVLAACLRETPMPIESRFEIVVADDRSSPVEVSFINASYGAEQYEWTFEGGQPSSATTRNPGKVVFSAPGSHQITLRVWNSVEERVCQQTLHVDSSLTADFDFNIAINDFAPGVVTLNNRSTGGSRFQWTFEGGQPATSDLQHPGSVFFAQGGEHRIGLKIYSESHCVECCKTVVLRPPLQAAFSLLPLGIDTDWEAPLTLIIVNKTQSATTYHWSCSDAEVRSPSDSATSVYFKNPGIYNIELEASNGKDTQHVSQQVVIKPNTGIIEHSNLKFGIKSAYNTLGCFYATKAGCVLSLEQAQQDEWRQWIDIGFSGINAQFNHCTFFAPSQMQQYFGVAIDGAQNAVVINNPQLIGFPISNAQYEDIKQPSDFDQFDDAWKRTANAYFSMTDDEHYVLLRMADMRRGIIRIKQFMGNGDASYIVADIKMEKRDGE